MSKNISIKERNRNLKYKTTFLKTALQGGGYCEWVPESEIETEVLRAYSNGYYTPDKYAFSEAVVNVPAIFLQGMEGLDQMIYSLDIEGIIISEIVPIDFPDINTNPFIMEDLRIITIDPTTGEKFDITFPEEFELMNSLLSPFSSDWLIADFGDDTQIISHPDDIDTTPFVDPVDTDGAQIPVVDVNLDNDYIIGVDDLGNFHVASINTEGFVSTTMLGFTPTSFAFDANGMMEGFDANGNSMVAILNDGVVTQESHVPTRIAIIQPPFNVRYHDGDTIDYTGIRVGAYKSNGDPFVFTDGEGSNKNEVPFADLTFPVTVANVETPICYTIDASGDDVDDYLEEIADPSNIKCGTYFQCGNVGSIDTYIQTTGDAIAGMFYTDHSDQITLVVASPTGNGGFQLIYSDRGVVATYGCNKSSTHNGQTVYYYSSSSWSHMRPMSPMANLSYGYYGHIERPGPAAWALVYGGGGVKTPMDEQYIPTPVQWQSRYRTEAFTAMFDIIVTEDGG